MLYGVKNMPEYNHLTFPLDFDGVRHEKQPFGLPAEMAKGS